jgi:hypothetical protein
MKTYFYTHSLPSAAWSMDDKEILGEAEDLVMQYSGTNFVDDITRYLSQKLKMDYVLVGRVIGENRVHTVSFYQFGQKAPDITYDLKGTPFEKTVSSSLSYYQQGIQAVYPKDKLLRELYIESYIGQPLFTAGGEALGTITLMHRETIPRASFVESLLSVISMRMAHEVTFRLFQ